MERRPFLQHVLREVAEAHGLDTALALAAAYGGQRLDVFGRARPDHPIARTFGEEVLRTLVSIANGKRLVIPMGPRHPDRVRAAWRRQEVARMSAHGASAAEIATALKCHVRQVERIREQLRAELNARQLVLL